MAKSAETAAATVETSADEQANKAVETAAPNKPQKSSMRQKSKKTAAKPKATQRAAQSDRQPYRPGSCYAAVVAGLRKLGLGRIHAWDKIVPAVFAELDDAKAFKSRKPRNKQGLGWRERIVQNVRTVARGDYGKPAQTRTIPWRSTQKHRE